MLWRLVMVLAAFLAGFLGAMVSVNPFGAQFYALCSEGFIAVVIGAWVLEWRCRKRGRIWL